MVLVECGTFARKVFLRCVPTLKSYPELVIAFGTNAVSFGCRDLYFCWNAFHNRFVIGAVLDGDDP
jgi:hypothetical protein